MFRRIWIKSENPLDAKTISALESAKCSIEQVRQIERKIKENQLTNKRHLLFIMLVGGIIFAFATWEIFFSGDTNGVDVFLVVIFIFIFMFLSANILLYKWIYVDGIYKRFVRTVKKGYPNYEFNQLD